jgi:hypothetical protein
MLNTDLRGFMENCKNNKMLHLVILLGVCIFLYILLSKYMQSRSNFNNVIILPGMVNNNMEMNNRYSKCNKDIPRMDEAIIRNTINLPNRNPALMTSSMVYPEPSQPSNEDRKRTRMDILNMFYSSFDDDLISIKARPQNLYVIP